LAIFIHKCCVNVFENQFHNEIDFTDITFVDIIIHRTQNTMTNTTTTTVRLMDPTLEGTNEQERDYQHQLWTGRLREMEGSRGNVSIKTRLKQLGILSQHLDILYVKHRMIVNGLEGSWQHECTDATLTPLLTQIGTRVAKRHKMYHMCLPKIKKVDRHNYYTAKDWELYGDNVLRA